jgi:uncharacterized protein (DUF1800 family)
MDKMEQKAHFWRRASFGATLEELNSSVSNTDLLQSWLQNNQSNQAIVLPVLGPTMKGKGRRNQFLAFSDWLLKQMVTPSNPLQEKVTNFWRDHFIVALNKISFPQLLTDYEQRLHAHALGDFRELLLSVTTSPAMLSYLDNARNRAGKLNENYSREVMELFTIGRGNYTEKDIQEGARALTGWLIKTDRDSGVTAVNFQPRRHDRGNKTFLGHSGNLKTEDVVDILANHPSTAKLIAAKLWSTFVYTNPEPAIVQRLAQVYKQSDRSIKAVVEAVFTAPEFYSAKAYRSRLKTPMYFAIGTIRQLQVKADTTRTIAALRSMGQVPYNAPTVKGWPQDAGWLTAPSLLTRLNLAQQIIKDGDDDAGFEYDAQRFTTNDLVTLLLDGKANPSLRNALDGLSPREATALILSSPTYQLA